MKRLSSRGSLRAFTLIELLVALIIVGLVFVLAVPVHHRGDRTRRAGCLSNLRQIGLGMLLFASDYTNHFPWQVSITNGGSMELLSLGSPASHFRTITNCIRAPSLLCPADTARPPMQLPVPTIADTNISYFVNVDAKLKADALLAGDRNLEVNSRTLKPGLFSLVPDAVLNWGPDLHSKVEGHRRGMLLFGDGHAEATKADSLQAISNRWSSTNRLAIP